MTLFHVKDDTMRNSDIFRVSLLSLSMDDLLRMTRHGTPKNR